MNAALWLWFWVAMLAPFSALAQTTPPPATNAILILRVEGTVEVSPAGSGRWFAASTNQPLVPGDRLRVGAASRAVLRWSARTTMPLDQKTFIQIPPGAANQPMLNLLRGALYFFHRDKPGVFPIGTPAMSTVVRGTEFHVRVDDDGTSTLQVLDGEVRLTNAFGGLALQSGQAGRATPGQGPAPTAALPVTQLIQWCLYYPGVLNLDELSFTGEEQQALGESTAAYRRGDLLAALALFQPMGPAPSDAQKLYHAALLLAVGRVDETTRLITEVRAQPTRDPASRTDRALLAQALERMVTTVKGQPPPTPDAPPRLATEWLAESYARQSQSRHDAALTAARNAVARAPAFAFAWVRVAELEFSAGRRAPALTALRHSLDLAPRNAQALALQGFVLAAHNRISEARRSFDQAIAVDSALGHGWLGRGLCRIRQGDTAGGLEDLQMAATVEPQRAFFRSYLAKAYSLAHDPRHAAQEITRAQELDPNDPTAWLYAALLRYERNQMNDAVRDLEHSQTLNDNRRVYRSSLMLEQDRAVGGVNLANLYQNAGLSDVSLWEASRAVSADYANFSAHLFLADSYQRLRDPNRVNLLYETPAVNEYLLATLLAPVGANTLAHSVSAQEYSKLFQQDGFGLASSTEYGSRGAWLQSAAQYGTFRNTAYALSGFYRTDPGQRANNDLEQWETSLQVQQQLSPSDSVYLRALYGEANGGDLAPYYDPTAPFAQGGPNRQLRWKETQEPILLAGYHHEWAPGSHTLFLGGRLQDTLQVDNPQHPQLLLGHDALGNVARVWPTFTVNQNYRSEFEMYSAEAQQIWQQPRQGIIAGARYQAGEFETQNTATDSTLFAFLFPTTPQSVEPDFQRASVYGYYELRPMDPLQLTVGLSYDWLQYPVNFRYAPISDQEATKDQVSPKAGLVWTPAARTVLRAGYARSLGGVSFDQSFRLEPTQVAGFNQAFRSILPEAVAGANSAATMDTWGISLEQRLGRGTFLGIGGEILNSEVHRVFGVYDFVPFQITPGGTREELEFEERTLWLSASQLLGREWSVGARYRLSQAELSDRFPDIPAGLPDGFDPDGDSEALWQQGSLFALYQHRCGFYSQLESLWNHQSHAGDLSAGPGEDFWQFNAFAGYRFPRRQADLRIGILNITDQNYRLNPLILVPELPRERTFVASLRFYF